MSALKICPTCGTEYPAHERFCPRDGTALRSQNGSADLVGSIIAERYHVIRKLGEGGMGQVYLAEHVKMGRKSAVKVMNPGMMHDADAISRFNREAANASRINHPNVAGIYDFGETPDGLIYLAMEFIEGEPLTSIVESEGALPPLRAADITRQTAEALAAAHDMGIVHRDLKPDNIMITKNRDGSDCVKVVDFGIAKAANSDAQKVTKTGLVVGTPEYMSPEQLAGDKLDGRSDVYSLALVAFNMLTGRLPFPSETAQESMIMRLTDRPKSLGEMKPDTTWTPDVQAVMDRALERDAKLRYQTATEFGQALYRAVQQMPAAAPGSAGTLVMNAATTAVPATRLDGAAAAREKAGRRTPMLIGAGAVVAALAGGMIVMTHDGGATKALPPTATSATPTVKPDSITPAGTTSTGPGAAPAPSAVRPSKPPGASHETNRAGTSSKSDATSPGIDEQLPALLAQSASDATARRALAELDALASRAVTREQRAGIALGRAQALGLLSRDAEACRALHSVEGIAGDTRYGTKIQTLLQAAC